MGIIRPRLLCTIILFRLNDHQVVKNLTQKVISGHFSIFGKNVENKSKWVHVIFNHIFGIMTQIIKEMERISSPAKATEKFRY